MQEVETRDMQLIKYETHVETRMCLQNEFV